MRLPNGGCASRASERYTQGRSKIAASDQQHPRCVTTHQSSGWGFRYGRCVLLQTALERRSGRSPFSVAGLKSELSSLPPRRPLKMLLHNCRSPDVCSLASQVGNSHPWTARCALLYVTQRLKKCRSLIVHGDTDASTVAIGAIG